MMSVAVQTILVLGILKAVSADHQQLLIENFVPPNITPHVDNIRRMQQRLGPPPPVVADFVTGFVSGIQGSGGDVFFDDNFEIEGNRRFPIASTVVDNVASHIRRKQGNLDTAAPQNNFVSVQHIQSGTTCRDTNQLCSEWATIGWCQENLDYMNDNCPASCSFCAPPETACRDKDQRCVASAANGMCQENLFMQANCPESCKMCVLPASDQQVSQTFQQSRPSTSQASTVGAQQVGPTAHQSRHPSSQQTRPQPQSNGASQSNAAPSVGIQFTTSSTNANQFPDTPVSAFGVVSSSAGASAFAAASASAGGPVSGSVGASVISVVATGINGHVRSSVCLEKPSPGECRGAFPRFFYNTTSDQCDCFLYGGCGNEALQSSWLTLAECNEICQPGNTQEGPRCRLLPKQEIQTFTQASILESPADTSHLSDAQLINQFT